MNYSAVYDRGALKVVHPQLETNVTEQRAGRKRFEMRKNEESSGLSYGYGMNHGQKKSFTEETSQAYPPRGDVPNEFYKASPYKQADYKSTNSYREQPGGSYNSNSYNQNNPGYGAGPSQSYGVNAGGASGYPPGPNGNLNREGAGKYMEQGRNQYDEGMYESYEEKYGNESNFNRDKVGAQYDEPKPSQSIGNQADYSRQYEDPSAPQAEEPKQGDYYDEIEKLKEELRRKELELASYSQPLNKTPPKQVDSQEAMYSRINKAMFDKQRTEEQRKVNSSTLDYQLNEKNRMKSLYQQEKEREQAIRLEMLRKLKEDEAIERMDKQRRAKEYREQLEVQNLVKSNIKNQERMLYKNDLPKSFEAPPQQYEPISRSNNSANNLGYSPASFTKKTPKTICYNPITGVLKDTSQFVYGSFPSYNVKDPSITYHKNQSNIPELAAHPAFQQVKFTKNHPKVVSSFPITGNPLHGSPSDARGDDPEAYKNQESRMMEYGQLMMKNS